MYYFDIPLRAQRKKVKEHKTVSKALASGIMV